MMALLEADDDRWSGRWIDSGDESEDDVAEGAADDDEKLVCSGVRPNAASEADVSPFSRRLFS
jgi:hypothetical protein